MFHRALFALALLLPAWALAEEPKWYEVELIVFERLHVGDKPEEVWPESVSAGPVTDAKELELPADATAEGNAAAPDSSPAPETGPKAFRLLSEDQLQLSDAWSRLRGSREYRPLMHIGWRQPLGEQSAGPRVHIHSHMLEAEQPRADAEPAPGLPSLPPPFQEGVPTEGEGTIASGAAAVIRPLDGTIALRRGQYLHIDADLFYRKLLEPNEDYIMTTQGTDVLVAEDEMVEKVFVIDESRRVRLDQLNYFDHPLFGLIAVVRPFELPEPEEPKPAQPSTAAPAGAPEN